MSKIHKILHPFMRKLGKSLIKFPITAFDVHPIPDNGPIIFVINHSNVHDFPMVLTVIPNQFFVLADDGPKGSPSGLAFEANGVIWVNRTNKDSRRESVVRMRDLLTNGNNILICPEGTWNMHECLPVLPITWSTTELAREFNCPIVPVTLEYPDFQSCYYSIGEPFYVQPSEGKAEAAARLRDTMATMRWKFWESRGLFSREKITQEDYEVYSLARHREYRPKDYKTFFEREKEMVFHPYTTPEQAFEHLEHLIPRRENAFLLDKRLKK